MNNPDKWTVIDVIEYFEEAVRTLKRLPSKKVQGYFNSWPDIVRTVWEKLQEDNGPTRLGPPSPAAISRMEETLNWIFWLDTEEERRLVWLRAAGVPWKPICWRLGCGRTTAHYRYRVALFKIVTHLNAKLGGKHDV